MHVGLFSKGASKLQAWSSELAPPNKTKPKRVNGGWEDLLPHLTPSPAAATRSVTTQVEVRWHMWCNSYFSRFFILFSRAGFSFVLEFYPFGHPSLLPACRFSIQYLGPSCPPLVTCSCLFFSLLLPLLPNFPIPIFSPQLNFPLPNSISHGSSQCYPSRGGEAEGD